MYSTAAANASLFRLASVVVTRAKGSSMYPAWATLEYASSRTICRWRKATRFPSVMVRIDSTAKIGAQKSATGANAMNISWSSPANPAALDGTDRNAATGMGAPSYVSGAQKWNGTLDTLKANPATTRTMAASVIDWSPAGPDSACAIPSSLVVPVTPKIRLIP